MKKSITLFFLFIVVFFSNAQSKKTAAQKPIPQKVQVIDTTKKSSSMNVEKDKKLILRDTIIDTPPVKVKLYKKSAHASYYADKFNGKRTASGLQFSNGKYTAAHKKFPFGTKLKITNEANGKSVVVEVTDRGPFVKSREVDLTKKAYMEIAANKNSGVMIVTIEEILPE